MCLFVFWSQYIHAWFSSVFTSLSNEILWEGESTTHSDGTEGSSELDETGSTDSNSTPDSGITIGSAIVLAGLEFDTISESRTVELLGWLEVDGIQGSVLVIGLLGRLDVDAIDVFSTILDDFF